MSKPWIKMSTDLRRHPKVVRMASALKADRLRIVGGLHSAWSVFDEHSEDGVLVGYTPEVIDDELGWPGFTRAMILVGWAEFDGESLLLPDFETHNGASAKRRAQDADRKRAGRMSALEADKKRTRGEERRVDKEQEHSAQPSASRFAEFWSAYPRKRGKKPAEAKWKAKRLDRIADELIADVRKRIASDDRWKRGFIPDPLTYLNQERWDDALTDAAPAGPAPRMGPQPPSETPLERVINRARHDHHLGVIDATERDRRIAQATAEHRGEARA